MTMTDPIADMFTRLKMGLKQQHKTVTLPASKMKKAVLDVLVGAGYLAGYAEADLNGHKAIVVDLKYYEGKPVITMLKRVSTPGMRVYSAATDLPMVANGLGVTIVSTSKGLMTDTKAREQKLGGEIIGQVS